MVPEWYIDTSYGNPENGFAQELHKARETLEDQQDLALEAFPIRISDLIIGEMPFGAGRMDMPAHSKVEWVTTSVKRGSSSQLGPFNATFVSRRFSRNGSMVRRFDGNAGGQMREDTRANRTVTNNWTRINGDDRIDADMLHVKSWASLRLSKDVYQKNKTFDAHKKTKRNHSNRKDQDFV